MRKSDISPVSPVEPAIPSTITFWMSSTAAGAAPPRTFSSSSRVNAPGAWRTASAKPWATLRTRSFMANVRFADR